MKRSTTRIFSIIITILLLFIITLNTAHAAELSGVVYTKDLELAKFSLLTINTTPAQRIILDDGKYKISLDPGVYFIHTSLNDGRNTYEDNATLKIADDGSYTYDFILFSTTQLQLQELPSIDNITTTDTQNTTAQPYLLLILGILTLAIIIGIITSIVLFLKRNNNGPLEIDAKSKTKNTTEKQPLNSDLQSILTFITEEGGRTTQKDLRRNIPCSEAKMSMMLTELEHKGKIERIKKGRANLIILK